MRAAVTLAAMAALLSGCIMLPCGSLTGCPAPSPAYLKVEGLSGEARTIAMKRLPLEQRLDIYHDAYIRSGHPRTMLKWAFEGSGQAGFDAVMGRMVDRSSFNEYFWIIHWLHLKGDVAVCEPGNFARLTDKAERFGYVDPQHPVPIDFGACTLIL